MLKRIKFLGGLACLSFGMIIASKSKAAGPTVADTSMLKGETLSIAQAYSIPVNQFKWKSNNPGVATVSANGVVKAVGVGNATITGQGKSTTCVYTIVANKKPKKIIYLTFDDGPSRSSTPKILKILKNNDVKATFFELKPARKDYDLTNRVISEGHTLALHGYQHKYDRIYKSESIYKNNLDKLRNLFYKKFGVWTSISRFPGGSSNTVSRYNRGIMSRLTKRLKSYGYKYFDWNVSSCDAGGAKNANQVYRSVKRELPKKGSAVVLMHDFPNNKKTINALDRIIKYGKKHGYVFLPIMPSTKEIHHGVNN